MFNISFFPILLIILSLGIFGSEISDGFSSRIKRQSHSDMTNNNLCSVPKIENGEFDFPISNKQCAPGNCSKQMPEGTIATMKCKPNFVELNSGSSTIACLNGSWDGPLIQCVPECGIPVSKVRTLIVNDTEVKGSTFPWNVAIYKQQTYKCDGSIISEKFVLSDAFCFSSFLNGKLYSVSEFTVAAGKIYRYWDVPEEGNLVQKRNISRIEIPKEYMGLRSKFAGDIAVVVLEEPFVLTDFIKPVCVDWNSTYVNDQLKDRAIGQVAEWKDLKDCNPAENTSSIQLPFSSSFDIVRQCLKPFGEYLTRYFTSDKFSALYTTGTIPCFISSGTGMVLPRGEQSGKKKYYIQGIQSYYSNSLFVLCRRTLHTKVAPYISFIRNVTSLNEIY